MATGFFFGTGNDDSDNASSKRKLAEAMLARGAQGQASNWAEGANKAAQMILGALLTKQSDQATSAADAAAFGSLFGGGAGGTPTAGAPANAAPSQTQDQMRAAAGIDGTAANKDAMDPNAVRSMFIDQAKRQGLAGVVPSDGAKYGITTGSPEEWGNLLTGLAKHESGLRNSTVGDVGQFDGGSRGLLQLSYADAPSYGLNGGRPFTPEQLADPNQNAAAGVAIAKALVDRAGSIQGGMGKYWGPISREGWTPGAGRDRGLPWGSWRNSDAGAAIDGAMGAPAGLPKGVQVASADPDYVPQSVVQAELAGQQQQAAAPMAYDAPMPQPRPQMPVQAPQQVAAAPAAQAPTAGMPAGARMVDGQPMFQRQTPQGITYWTPYANADNAPDAPSRSPIDAITSLLSSRQQSPATPAAGQAPQAAVQAAMGGGAAAPAVGAAAAAPGGDRTAALMRAATNPNLSPQMRAVIGAALQQQMKPVEYGFQTLPDGTIIKTDPRTGQVAPVYQAAPKPVTLSEGAALVDPTTGKVIASTSPKPMSVPEGGSLVDPATGRVVAGGGQKATAEQKDYEAAKAGGYTGSFSDYQVMLKKASAPTAESKFDQEIGTKQAAMFSDMLEAGQAARGDIATIGRLRETLSKTPGGMAGGLLALANSFGLKVGSQAQAIEATSSLLSKLTPQQRQGMPGAASDRDVAMFRDALPKLGNTPEGNAVIMDTMQALAERKIAEGDIAAKVTTGQMSRQDAIAALQALPDPFAKFKAAQGGKQPEASGAVDTSKPGAFVFNPATGKLEPAK